MSVLKESKDAFEIQRAEAWHLQDLGWHLLPIYGVREGRCECGRDCHSPGKHPKTAHGLKDATNDARTLSAWEDRWPGGSTALRTGPESGVVVIDIDLDKGGPDSWTELTAGRAPIRTVTAITGGGGRHYFFNHPGETVRNRRGSLGPGIDIRGDNGYVVLPGSTHLDGVYSWLDGHSPLDLDLADLPKWLAAQLIGA